MSKPPFQFRPQGAQAVPILGTPYDLKAVLPTVILHCKCEAATLIVLQGLGAQGQCPVCRRAFMLEGVEAAINGPHGARIATGIPTQIEN